MQRRHRLSRSQDFDAVYRQAARPRPAILVLYWFPREDEDDEPRLGLAVPKNTGDAVQRNRIKRRLREAVAGALEHVPRRQRLRARRAARAPGGGGCARIRLARRACRRSVEKAAGMKFLGMALVYAVPLAPSPGCSRRGACKYHPTCSQYAIDAFRKHGLVKGSYKAAWRLAALQPVEPRGRRPRRDRIVAAPSILSPIENILADVIDWLARRRRSAVGLGDRRADGDGADRARPATVSRSTRCRASSGTRRR